MDFPSELINKQQQNYLKNLLMIHKFPKTVYSWINDIKYKNLLIGLVKKIKNVNDLVNIGKDKERFCCWQDNTTQACTIKACTIKACTCIAILQDT